MQQKITQDGSVTLYNEQYQEFYHSKSGAKEEAVEKYIRPCRIAELAAKGHLRILDIGFGLGYNVFAAIDAAKEANPSCEIEIISLEKDHDVISEAKKLELPFKSAVILKHLEHDPRTDSYLYEDKNLFVKIKMGDALDTIKNVDGKFDAVFFDPFSLARNPELWALYFYREVHALMKKEAILSTYSYAKSVRDGLKEAGFDVFDGPVIGRRSPCTLARPM